MGRNFIAEFKAQVVLAMLKEEKAVSQRAAEHGIHPNQLYRWRDEARAGLPRLFSTPAAQQQAAEQTAHTAQVEQLYAEIGKLTTQLSGLKKDCRPNAPVTARPAGEQYWSPATRRASFRTKPRNLLRRKELRNGTWVFRTT